MSWEKHVTALLDGLIPQFPKSIDQLNDTYEKAQSFFSFELDDVFDMGDKTFERKKIRTSDSYIWLSAIVLPSPAIPAGSVTIAFPMANSEGQSDRSIAFYSISGASHKYLEKLCLEIIELFRRYNDLEKEWEE
jgi:hypothetical protein